MALYLCKTIAPSGAIRKSSIEAASQAEARSVLQARGEIAVRIHEVSNESEAQVAPRGGKKASADEVAVTIRQMSILIRAGVPLVEGIRSLAEQAKTAALRDCLEQVAAEVSQGESLSRCFMRYPNVFPNLAVEMAKVAEAGGNLAEALSKLAGHMEKAAEIRRKVKSALAYPLVVVCISIVTVVVLVTFILPRFTKLFQSMNAKIPATTRALMWVSHFAIQDLYLIAAALVLFVFLARRFARSTSGRRRLDAIAPQLPIVGDIVSKIVIGRVLASMATLLSSGIPMVQTIETSASAADNYVVKQALMTAKRQLAEGNAVSQSLRSAGVFPPLVLQMVASGEKTGELPAMLEHVCALYDQETDAKVKSLTSVIEPILIVGLGLIVGFIAISVIVPIYSLVGGVK